jgi:hypothetical protein
VLVVRLVPVARVAQVAQLVLVVRLVLVAQVALVAPVALVVRLVLASEVNAQDSAVALVPEPEPEPVSVPLALAVAQVLAVAVVSAVEPRVHSVRVARAETQRPASPSAQNAKNLNKELRRA